MLNSDVKNLRMKQLLLFSLLLFSHPIHAWSASYDDNFVYESAIVVINEFVGRTRAGCLPEDKPELSISGTMYRPPKSDTLVLPFTYNDCDETKKAVRYIGVVYFDLNTGTASFGGASGVRR